MGDIRVSSRLIRLVGQNLYSTNPIFPVTVRELLQNSIDAQRAKNVNAPVSFSIIKDASSEAITLVCEDAGVGMDKETIRDKFLVVGESGKNDGVGGFGIAKAAIILSCDNWVLKTQNNVFVGSGIQGAEQTADAFVDGCRIELNYMKHPNSRLYPYGYIYNNALEYLITSNVPSLVKCKLLRQDQAATETIQKVNGLELSSKTMLEQFSHGASKIEIHCVPAIQYESISFYNSLSLSQTKLSNRIIYRLNGLTQFTSCGYGDAEFNLVVEVSTTARPDSEDYPFTLSREEVNNDIQNILSKKLRNYFINAQTTTVKIKEISGQKITYKESYEGYLCSGKSNRERKILEAMEAQRQKDQATTTEFAGLITQKLVTRLTTAKYTTKQHGDYEPKTDLLETSVFGIKTLIERTADTLKINVKNNRHIKLVQAWAEIITLVMTANPEYQHSFGIGLILDEDFAALRKYYEGTTYYLFNPLRLKVSDPMTTITKLLFSACHEVAHTHHQNHNESFVVEHGKLMDNFLEVYGMNALYEIARTLRGK
jgi:hypothetical protein